MHLLTGFHRRCDFMRRTISASASLSRCSRLGQFPHFSLHCLPDARSGKIERSAFVTTRPNYVLRRARPSQSWPCVSGASSRSMRLHTQGEFAFAPAVASSETNLKLIKTRLARPAARAHCDSPSPDAMSVATHDAGRVFQTFRQLMLAGPSEAGSRCRKWSEDI